MFNAGSRGKRAKDSTGLITVGEHFNQQNFLVPTVTRFAVTDGSYVDTNDTAADPAGSQTIVLYGSGFAPGATVLVGSTTIGVVTFLDSGRLTFSSPVLGSGSYTIFVTNATGGTGILVPGLVYSGVPTFTTSAGTLGSVYETTAISTPIVATGDAPITYVLSSGSLPSGSTLSSGGTISGTAPVDGSSTTYSFTVQATDAENQDSVRSFSLTINTDVVSFSSPANNTTTSASQNGAISNVTIVATSAAGYGVLYTSSGLPTGLSMNTSTGIISGTPTVVASNTSIITATANTTTRTAALYLNWTINLPGDAFWKYASLLMSANSAPNGNTFNTDASTINNEIVVSADTKPNKFHPFKEGYYSNFFDGTGDYLAILTSSAFNIATNSFTVEAWINTSSATQQSIFNISDTASSGYGAVRVQVLANQTVQWLMGPGGSWGVAVTAGSIVLGAWNHIAITRNGSSVYFFVNGLQVSTTQTYATSLTTGGTTYIGYNSGTAYGFNGYISNFRFVNGTALYTANTTLSTAPLTYVANTSLLTCQSNKLIDNSNNNFTITKGGDTKVNPFSPFNGTPTTITVPAANNYSVYFDGTGDYLTVADNAAFTMGSGDFTVEMWINLTAANGSVVNITGQSDNAGWAGSQSFVIYRNASNQIVGYVVSGSTQYICTSTTTVTAGTWNHIGLVRNGNTLAQYINGVANGTASVTGVTINDSSQILGIGCVGAYTTSPVTGYISNYRIVKGTAVYTAAFTPSTTPLTAIANTSLLTAQANTVIDNSNNAFAITTNGDVRPTRNGPFANTTTVTLVGNEGSAYFDGSGDCLGAESSNGILPADFTVEMWVYLTSSIANQPLVAFGTEVSGRFALLTNASGQLKYAVYGDATEYTYTTIAMVLNTWTHVAFSRTGTNMYAFINGALAGAVRTLSGSRGNGTRISVGAAAARDNSMTGYLSNVRVVNGTGLYTSAFVPSFAPSTPVANTVLLTAQTNLSSNTKVIVDESNLNNIVSGFGNSNLGTFSPFGSSRSVYFDGNGDYLSIAYNTALNLSSGNFTIEAWVLNTVNTAGATIIQKDGVSGSTYYSYNLSFDSSGYVVFGVGSGNSTAYLQSIGGTTSLTVNTWYHIAGVKSGTTLSLYINGILNATATQTGTIVDGGKATLVGYQTGQPTAAYWSGYISNARIVKGTALYTTTFTPSTTPLVSVANTVLLTCNSNRLFDYAAANNVITKNGDAAVSEFSPFSTVTVTPASYSGYFDGTGDYLVTPINAGFDMGTGDFTVECFVINNGYSGSQYGRGLFTIYPGASYNQRLMVRLNSGYNLMNMYGYNGSSIYLGNSGTNGTILLSDSNKWYHIAVVRQSGVFKLYVDGVQDIIVSNQTSISLPTSCVIEIGRTQDGTVPDWNGYISNFRVVKGVAVYTAAFTPPTAQLGLSQSASANTVALGIPANGNSVYFDGTGDYLSVPSNAAFQFGTGDFTIEAWVYMSAGTSGTIFDNRTGTTSLHPVLYFTAATTLQYYVAGAAGINSGSYTFLNKWVHVVVCRASGSTKMFFDGVQTGSTYNDTNNYSTSGTVLFGAGLSGANLLTGYISNLRVVKGTAVYTTAFTPPTGPLTAITNTSLLTCQNSTPSNTRIIIDSSTNAFAITPFGDTILSRWSSPFGNTASLLTCQSTTFVDTSNNAFAITVNGNAKPVIQNPFTDTVSLATSYSANTFGNSVYFDGTADYLNVTPATALAFGTSDFTVEAWAYLPNVTSQQSIVYLNGNTSGYAALNLQVQSGALNLWMSSTGSAWSLQQGTIGSISANTWTHIAVTKSSTTMKVYINGTQAGTNYSVASSLMATYTLNQIGVYNTSSYLLTGYLSNLRVVMGTALYTTPFIPSDQPLRTTSNTTLLLASTVGPSTADATRNHNIETFGTARHVANNSPYYDTYSAFFDGTGDYLTFGANQANLGLGTGDFTFEFWFNAATIPSTEIDIFESQTTGSFRILKRASSSGLSYDWYGGSSYLIKSDATITTNEWHHVAVSRTSGTVSAYYDGTRVIDQADSTSGVTPTANYSVGGRASGAYYLTGYISNMRLIKGTGLYSGTTITVPTSPLTAVANTQLLICNNNRFIDGSTNAFTITKAGDAKITAFEPFANSNNSRFNSVYYATKTDYLAVRPQPNIITFPGDFTFECWVYPTDTTLTSSWGIWDSRQSGATTNPMIFLLTALASPVTGSWRLTYYNGTSYYGTGTVLWNQWTHVAWVRSGTTMTFYVNGVAGGTATISGTQTGAATTAPIYIGSKDNGLAGYGTIGYIADFRITNGAARTITVPTAPYDIK